VATQAIIGLCALVYVAMVVSGVSPMSPSVDDLFRWGGDAGVYAFHFGQPWRLLTCIFIHAGIVHIGFNMYVLWDIGRLIERMCGIGRYVLFYLLCGLGGSITSALVHPRVVSVGASGAIFGLYGILLGFVLRHRRVLPENVYKRVGTNAGVFVVYNIIFSVAASGVDLSAHLGGLGTGLLIGLIALQ
jgi:rhomboid protease GluP